MENREPRLTYALNKNNELVHISQVQNGLKCECFCPSCKEPLIARQGRMNRHSFAHINQETPCEYAYQTSLHLLAKELIAERCEIKLPPVYIDRDASYIKETYEEYCTPVQDSKIIKADSVVLEKKISDFIPDVILTYKNTPLIVEIYVTHPVDITKKEKIEKTGISVVEFDLRNVDRDIDKETLKEILASGEFCRWIYNRKGHAAINNYKKRLEEKKKQIELQRIKEEKQKEQRKKELISKNGGNLKKYKVYNVYLDFELKNVIFDPPCKEAEIYNNKRCKPINGCHLCPYFVKIEPSEARDVFGGLAQNVSLWCQRQKYYR